jgi:hypothetical protein
MFRYVGQAGSGPLMSNVSGAFAEPIKQNSSLRSLTDSVVIAQLRHQQRIFLGLVDHAVLIGDSP